MRLILSVLLLSGVLAHATLSDDLTTAQKKQLASGQSVQVVKTIPGAIWPKVTIYNVVDATPQQVYNLFTDYASAPSYTPNMISAKVIATPDANTKDVRYTVKFPVLSKVSYTVRNFYSQKGGSYEVKWQLLESPLAKESTGSLRVDPYEDGQSLLRYSNHVVPSTRLAAGLKGQALSEAQKTVNAITAEANKRAQTHVAVKTPAAPAAAN
ncbi:MAG: SRPBCC family protein [Chthoniobacterales bacterium]